MNRTVLFAVCILVFVSAQGIELDYADIEEIYPGEDLNILAIVKSGFAGIEDAELVLRTVENDSVFSFSMDIEDNLLTCFVDYDSLPEEAFYYYFEIIMKDRSVEIYPLSVADRMKNRVNVIKSDDFWNYDVELIYPLKDKAVRAEDFMAAVFVEGEYDRLRVLINDRDVTDECMETGNTVLYIPRNGIEAGNGSIVVYIDNEKRLEESFNVIEKASVNVIGGFAGLSAEYSLYSGNGYEHGIRTVDYLSLYGRSGMMNYSLSAAYLLSGNLNHIYSASIDMSIPHLNISAGDYSIDEALTVQSPLRGVRTVISLPHVEACASYSISDPRNQTLYNSNDEYSLTMNRYALRSYSHIYDFEISVNRFINNLISNNSNLTADAAAGISLLESRFKLGGKAAVSFTQSSETPSLFALPEITFDSFDIQDDLSYELHSSYAGDRLRAGARITYYAPRYISLGLPYLQSDFYDIGGDLNIMFPSNSVSLNSRYSVFLPSNTAPNHYYSAGFEYSKPSVPSIIVNFGHFIQNNENNASGIIKLSAGINHTVYIGDRDMKFALSIMQNTFNTERDSVNADIFAHRGYVRAGLLPSLDLSADYSLLLSDYYTSGRKRIGCGVGIHYGLNENIEINTSVRYAYLSRTYVNESVTDGSSRIDIAVNVPVKIPFAHLDIHLKNIYLLSDNDSYMNYFTAGIDLRKEF
ncbi:MAG: hypothetical protein SVK54_05975 [candidate division WOR-3 bacterium]|nr:hypothetical protein [candidate division WOR-3 bacterium]